MQSNTNDFQCIGKRNHFVHYILSIAYQFNLRKQLSIAQIRYRILHLLVLLAANSEYMAKNMEEELEVVVFLHTNVAGRFVRNNNLRIIHNCPGNSHALLLSPWKLIREMGLAIIQPPWDSANGRQYFGKWKKYYSLETTSDSSLSPQYRFYFSKLSPALINWIMNCFHSLSGYFSIKETALILHFITVF